MSWHLLRPDLCRMLRWLALALTLLAGNTCAAPTDATASYLPSATPQLLLDDGKGQQIMLTLLRSDLLHVAYGEHLHAGLPYFSPMLAQPDFPGTPAVWDAAQQRLSSSDLTVEAEHGCWQVSDVHSTPPRRLARFCVANHSADSLRLSWSAEGNTDVLGLGEVLSSGRSAPSWLGQQREGGGFFGNAMVYSDIAASGNTQVPVAYVLGAGLRNYAVFFDTPFALHFDFSGPQWQVSSEDGQLGMFLWSGADIQALRRQYLNLTGHPPVPPLKAFGLWISEYGYDDWAELDSKLNTLHQRGFPIDGAVLDLQWFGGIEAAAGTTHMGGLNWDSNRFPAPAAKLAAYASQGVGTMLIEESYIGADLPEHTELAKRRYLAMQCPPPCTDAVYLDTNPWWGVGGMLDWSNPAAGAWWHTQKRAPLIDMGVLGHWTDLGEPEQFDAAGYYHGLDWYGSANHHHAAVHNLYNFFWSQSIAEGMARSHPTHRPWILSRSGTAGSQRFGVAMWSGDVKSSFPALAAQMPAQSNMSLSGFDYYGSDIGGFTRSVVDGNLYTHWLVASSLLDVPVRPHVNNLCNCFETAPDRVGDRASNLAALQLRYQLIPYLYSLAHQAYADGEAVFPPLLYHFQSDPGARKISKTKMIGPWLLFTATSDDVDTISSYLPPGRWTNFYHHEQWLDSKGGNHAQAALDHGLLRAPLYLREGAIVPLLRQAPGNLGNPRSLDMHWFADLLVSTVPVAKASQFVLYEDDGISRAYQSGKLARTTIRAQQTEPGHFQVGLSPDNRTGSSGQRVLSLNILTGGQPVGQVQVNGQSLSPVAADSPARGWYASAGGITVQLGSVSVDDKQEVLAGP